MNSRDKGARAEREVCELLRAWWEPFEPGVEFVRSPGSGGWARQGTRSRAEFKAGGDVVTTSKTFPFCVECKYRQAWSEGNLLKGFATPVEGWWRQAKAAAVESNSTPLLVFRKIRQPWWVLLKPATSRQMRRLVMGWAGVHRRELAGDEVLFAPFDQMLADPPSIWATRCGTP
jgi:Holliday junction resolvase